MDSDDRSLAASLLQSGDEAAFRLLYRRHTPRLFKLVLRLLGGVEFDAEDVVQETWLRACQRLGGFRWESAFSTWLTSIGIHVAQDHLRRRGHSPLTLFSDLPETSDPRQGSRLPIDLEQAIARLPSGFRQVLVLHDIEGWTHGEIAVLLGIAEGTSKSQLSAARQALRLRLREGGPTCAKTI